MCLTPVSPRGNSSIVRACARAARRGCADKKIPCPCRNRAGDVELMTREMVLQDILARIGSLKLVLANCVKRRMEAYDEFKHAEAAAGAAWQMFAMAEAQYNAAFASLQEVKNERQRYGGSE